MPAINYNFVIEQGSEFNLQFQYNNASNNPVDLSSNYCAVMQILPDNLPVGSGIYFSSSANAVYSVNDWQLTVDNLGVIDFKLGSKYTNTMTYDSALYDLDLISTTDPNKNLRLSFGIITIEKRQTLYPECSVSSDTNNSTNNTNTNTGNYDLLPVPINGDFCSSFSCLDGDLYSVTYNGSGLSINDNSSVSGYVETNDNRIIENVELSIINLNHTIPQDLQFLLAPPSGDKILLSANQKITNYSNNFSFAFSNKAMPGDYLHNILNNKICNIYDKTSIVKYGSDNLLSGFDHLFGNVVNGRWHLIARDTDPGGSGSISEWKLIVTYVPDET
jgi:subtilisin-like proprotein convertase family protein